MGYIMQRGAAPKFKELGSSPLEYEKDPKEFEKRKSKEDLQTKVNIGPKVDPDAPGTPGTPGYESEVKSIDYLTKTPVGPVATKKKIVEEEHPDSSTHISAAPTFSDHMDEALMNKKAKENEATKT